MRCIIVMLLVIIMGSSLNGQTIVDFDVATSSGITPGVGGTWDFNNTVNWSADNGTNRTGWTSNANIARLQLDTAYGWGSVTMIVTNETGQVAPSGVWVLGDLPGWVHTKFRGEPLRVGAAGIRYESDQKDSWLKFESPVELAASQTWRSSVGRNDKGGNLEVNSTLSSVSGTTDITFDGMDRYDAGLFGSSDTRVGFILEGNNTFSGATTVTGGGYLGLAFSGGYAGSKLDASSPLILRGGGIWMLGNSATFTQQVASTSIQAGTSVIRGSNSDGIFHCGAISHAVGGVIDFPVSWNGGTTAYTTTTNINGILGGWATRNKGGFAKAGTSGSNTAISDTSGSQKHSMDSWSTGDNVQARSGGTRTAGDVAINALYINTDDTLNFGGSTVTIISGGIIANKNGDTNHISGGTLLSGLGTGELFVHAFKNCQIDAIFADNGSTPGILVKSGTETLTFSASNTYSGATYINSGTLILTNEAFLANTVVQAGGTTVDVRNGGALCPGGNSAGTMTLNGNLTLEDGAILNIQLGDETDVIDMSNEFATFTGASSVGGITLNILDGENIVKQVYPIIQWEASATTNGLNLTDFTVVEPDNVSGTLQWGIDSLEFNVTFIPPKGTVISIK